MIAPLTRAGAWLATRLWSLVMTLLGPPRTPGPGERRVRVVDLASGAERWAAARVGDGSAPPEGLCIHDRTLDAEPLGAQEHVLWPRPLTDRQARRRTLDKNDYFVLHELRDFPTHTVELRSWFVARAANVRRVDLLKGVLDRGGFDLAEAHGFATDEGRPIEGIHVFVATHRATGRSYVGVRGTSSFSDVSRDLNFALMPIPDAPGLVHRGFWRGACEADGSLTTQLSPDAVFAGHSMGAAMATLLYVRRSRSVPRGRVMAFAPLPLGDAAFGTWIRQSADRLIGFVVPGEESLGVWAGELRRLPAMRRAGRLYHLPINYSRGMLLAEGLDEAAWLSTLPRCVAERGDPYSQEPVLHQSLEEGGAERRLGRRWSALHLPGNTASGLLLASLVLLQALFFLPLVWLARRSGCPARPRVLVFSDIIDELNGIALNTRLVTKALRSAGHDVTLVGTANHTRRHGLVEADGTVLLPAAVSMQQIGYSHSEMAVPRLSALLGLFRSGPVDVIQVETPGFLGSIASLYAWLLGIPLVHHYRTDIAGFAEEYAANAFVSRVVVGWSQWMCRLADRVIAPSSDVALHLVEAAGVAPDRVVHIQRGIDLEAFATPVRDRIWSQVDPDHGGTRFVVVGRVSVEKELPFLERVWRRVRMEMPCAKLLIVGDGPYLHQMRARCVDLPEVYFTGALRGKDLSAAYAHADYSLFASGRDTFGSVVVEALAAGTPVLATARGGPKDVLHARCGWLLPFLDEAAWAEALLAADGLSGEERNAMATLARVRAARFAPEAAAASAWALWEGLSECADRRDAVRV